MKFHNKVSRELRLLLTDDLQRYIKEVQMTDSERQELCQWVQAGNNPYDNGWNIATDAGTPMDYISAKRIVESGTELIAAYETVRQLMMKISSLSRKMTLTTAPMKNCRSNKVPEDHC